MKKIIIVGATGGLGTKICECLVDKDFELFLISTNRFKLSTLIKNLKKVNKKIKIKGIICDISELNSVKKSFSKIKKADVLINCAAILGPVGQFDKNDLNKWAETIKVNLIGSVNTCGVLINKINKNKGVIINFSGGGGAYPRKGHSAYASSKAAVIRFTENLAVEYPNIRINAVAPGAHKTNIWKGETIEPFPEKWASDDRFKELILFLCSERSKGISGKLIHINDDWENWNKKNLSAESYVLRRISP